MYSINKWYIIFSPRETIQKRFLCSYLHCRSNLKYLFQKIIYIMVLNAVLKINQYPMDYTVHGILQARILEWVAFPFSRGSSQPRDWTQVSHIAGGFFTSWATREAQLNYTILLYFCIVFPLHMTLTSIQPLEKFCMAYLTLYTQF